MANWEHLFTAATLEEKVRLESYARSRGYSILPIAEEVEGIEPKPISVIPAAEIPRDHFTHLTDSEFSKLQHYYSTAERGELYPPAGYNPSTTRIEKDAAATLRFMFTVGNRGGQEELDRWNYPLRKLPTPSTSSPVAQPKRGLVSRLTSFLR